jgi:hypothetical protein
MTEIVQGSLFSTDFLSESISETDDWRSLQDGEVRAFVDGIAAVFGRFPHQRMLALR